MQIYQTEALPFSSTTKEEPQSPPSSSANTGRKSELIFEQLMLEAGYTVSKPPEFSPYDYVVDNCGSMHRVQVKTLRRRPNGRLELKLRSTHRSTGDHSYTPEDADWVVGVDTETWLLYWVSTSEINGRTSITI